MDTSSSVVLAISAAAAGLLRIRAILKHGSFRAFSPSFFVAAALVVSAAAWVATALLVYPFLNACILYFICGVSISIVPGKLAFSQDAGCKYTPLVASTFSLVKTFADTDHKPPVYLIVALAALVGSCLWLAAPRVRVKLNVMCDSDVKSCMQTSSWPAFDLVDRDEEMTVNISSNSGDSVNLDRLGNGQYQVHARGKGENVVRKLKASWWAL